MNSNSMLNNTLDPRYKNKIDETVAGLQNINHIYGGRTEQSLKERLDQHQREDKKFIGMKSKQIFCIKSKHKLPQMKLAETYLINKLKEKFGNTCFNKNLIGGGTINYNEGDINKLYIMYK